MKGGREREGSEIVELPQPTSLPFPYTFPLQLHREFAPPPLHYIVQQLTLLLLSQMVKVEEVKDAHFEDEDNDSVSPRSSLA